MSTNIKINSNGFREYDARWLYEKDINLLGLENLGKGLGTQIVFQQESIQFRCTVDIHHVIHLGVALRSTR